MVLSTEEMLARRFLVFHVPQYYPAGGMNDLMAYFPTREDADTYVATLDPVLRRDATVVDLRDAATWTNPYMSLDHK